MRTSVNLQVTAIADHVGCTESHVSSPEPWVSCSTKSAVISLLELGAQTSPCVRLGWTNSEVQRARNSSATGTNLSWYWKMPP